VNQKNADLARRRAEVIIEVRAGRMTAMEGARQLGISRKTYYQWEHRALRGMIDALMPGRPGRPPKPKSDPQATRLEKQLGDLQRHHHLQQEVSDMRRSLAESHNQDPPPKPPNPKRPPPRRKKKP